MRYLCLVVLLSVVCLLAASEMEPGRVVFRLHPQCKPLLHPRGAACGIASIDEQLAALGATAVRPRFRYNVSRGTATSPDLSLILEASYPAWLSPWGVASLLARDQHVDWAEPVFIDSVMAVPNDPLYADSPYLAALHAEEAWDIHKGENGAQPVIVASSDTGVNWRHEDLVGNIWRNLGEDADGDSTTLVWDGDSWELDPGDLNGLDDDGNGYVDDLIGWDFMQDATGAQGNDPADVGSHGTRTAGIAAMRTGNATGAASISWNVTLMPLSCSYPGDGNIYRGYDSIIYAAENGARVINCSWGGTSYSHAAQEVIDYVWSLGGIVVSAAGNSNNTTPYYPASYAHVVGVAATMNDGAKTSASSYGPSVDVAAPIDSVMTTIWNTYTSVNTYTSFASPVAAGLCALIVSQHPEWDAATVVNQLVATCDGIDAQNTGLQNQLGQGMLNAQRALSETAPQPDQELRVSLFEVERPNDADGDGAVEPGETFTMNLTLRNWGLVPDSLTCTLTSHSASATVLSDEVTVYLPADDYARLQDQFLIQISPGAGSQYLYFTLDVNGTLPIVTGSSYLFNVLVNAGGTLVWESYSGWGNLSGQFIRDRLLALGVPVTYGNTYPTSLQGFDSVYMSFGTSGAAIKRLDTVAMYEVLRDYLRDGGRLYMEGGDVIGWDMPTLPVGGDTLASDVLWPLLGVASASDGDTNDIDDLSGEGGWSAQGMHFHGTTQTRLYSIDTYTPGSNGVETLRESDYGVVAVQGIGQHGQRSVVCSYVLRELVDGAAPSTREELVSRIHGFLTADSLAMPPVDSLLATAHGDTLRLRWSYPFPVDGFDVYGSDAPDGGFDTLEASTAQPWQDVIPAGERRFYRVLARRVFGINL